MDCDAVRTALSARLDGESTDIPDDVVDAHLASCEDCQRWYSTVSTLGRHLKFDLAPQPIPQGAGDQAAARLLDAAEDFPHFSSHVRARSLPLVISRVLLGGLAFVFLVWAGALLFSPTLGAGVPLVPSDVSAGTGSAAEDAAVSRLVMEAATVKFALGVGLGFVAFRPSAAGPVLPIYLAMWAFGAGIATRDIVMGLVAEGYDIPGVLGNLFVHLIAVVALITCWLARLHAVTPLRQYWRWLTAQPVSFSRADVENNSTYRAGD